MRDGTDEKGETETARQFKKNALNKKRRSSFKGENHKENLREEVPVQPVPNTLQKQEDRTEASGIKHDDVPAERKTRMENVRLLRGSNVGGAPSVGKRTLKKGEGDSTFEKERRWVTLSRGREHEGFF